MEIEVFSLLYLIVGIVPFGHCFILEYHFIDQSLSWPMARNFCRLHYTDLARVDSDSDLDRIIVPTGVIAWIGLWDDPRVWKQVMGDAPNSWKWSATGKTNPGGFQNWIWWEPNKYSGTEACAFIGPDGYWKDYFCSIKMNAVCFTVDSGVKTFIFVNTTLSWAAAMDYCRQNYLDLATIESMNENQIVTAMIVNVSDSAWMGLFRSPWVWSDNTNSSYRHWTGGKLDNAGFIEDCIAQNDTQVWLDKPCSVTYPFICYKELKRGSTKNIKFTFQSNTALTDAYVNNQILNQLRERLESVYGGVDFLLNWNTMPTKEEDQN